MMRNHCNGIQQNAGRDMVVNSGVNDGGHKTTPATVKLTDQAKEHYTRLAQNEGMGLSTYIREALSFYATFHPEVRVKLRKNAQMLSLLAGELK